MHGLVLGDERSRWPWHAFLNLPVIPLTLIASRFSTGRITSPLIPILLAWPASHALPPTTTPLLRLLLRRPLVPLYPAPIWPPSPTLLVLVFPIVRSFYTVARERLKMRVADTREPLPLPGPIRRLVWALGEDDGPGMVHININAADDRHGAEAPNADDGDAPVSTVMNMTQR